MHIRWHAAAAPFVALYVVGVPLTFAVVLRRAVRPALIDDAALHEDAAATLKWERRCLLRFGLQFPGLPIYVLSADTFPVQVRAGCAGVAWRTRRRGSVILRCQPED